MIADHDIQLDTIQWYKAPQTDRVSPKAIEEGVEYLELIVGGTVFFKVDGGLEAFRYGSLFWHIPGEETVSLTVPDDPYECVVFKFRRQQPITRDWPRAIHLRDPEKACEFGREMLVVFHDERSDRDALSRYTYSWLEWHVRQSRLSSTEAGLPESIQSLVTMIDTFPERDLTVNEMSRIAGLSNPHLHTLFRQHLATTPHQYVLARRLNRARHLIVSTNNPVKHVCQDCGFDNIETFYRCFKKRFGVSPGEFRKRNRPI